MTTVTADAYARQFNEHFGELARQIPSFAELRGLFDLTIAVALIRRERWQTTCELPLALLLDEKQLTVAQRPVPKQVRSLANLKTVGGATVIAQVGGGVSCRPQALLPRPTPDSATSPNNPPTNTAPARQQFLEHLSSAPIPATSPDTTRWWWDLAPVSTP
jgi:hypothetical protein